MPDWIAWIALAVLNGLIIWGCIACPPECIKHRAKHNRR